jgi:hypothetical protein
MLILLTADRYKQLDIAIEALGTASEGLDYQQIADTLNAPTTAHNPAPQPMVRAGSVADAINSLMAAPTGLDPLDLAALQSANNAYKILQDTGAALNRPIASTDLYLALLSGQQMSVAGRAAFELEASKTMPDPSWESTITTPSEFQPPATPEDIQAYYSDRGAYQVQALQAELDQAELNDALAEPEGGTDGA